MKKVLSLSMVFITSLVFIACEKVIEVDLEDQESKLIIEAKLSKLDQRITVDISMTTPYFAEAETEYISNAQITLTDQNGLAQLIPYTQNGHYELSFDPSINMTYSISVLIDGKLYEATSIMPGSVPLNNLESEFQAATPATDEGYGVFARFNDPADQENYYRIIHHLNGAIQNDGSDLQVITDGIGNGNYLKLPLFQQVFNSGDRVFVELVHFDEASYEYFNSLGDILGGQGPTAGTAAPGNPVTNWNGDAGGYFSAYTSDTLSLIIP